MPRLLKLVWLLIFVVACSRQSDAEYPYPGVKIPSEDFNTSLRLVPRLDWQETFQATGILALDIENLSNGPILFPPDYGVLIFMRSGEDWLSLDNDFGYPDTGHTLPTESDFPPGDLVPLAPVLPASDDPISIRVFVVGELVQSDREVGAFLDLTLPPSVNPAEPPGSSTGE